MTPVRLVALLEATTVSGPAKNLIEFCRRARAAGVEAAIVTFRRGGPEESVLVTACRAAGVEVHQLAEAFRFDPRVLPALARLVERLRPDVVQTHQVKSHLLVALSGAARARPWVAFHHGYTFTDLKMRAYNQLDRWSLPRASRVVTVSRPFADQIAAMGVPRGRIRVVHNSVRVEYPDGARADARRAREAALLRQRLGITHDERVVVAVGRLSQEKAFPELVRALVRLRTIAPTQDAWLVVVGEGPERARIQGLADQLGVAHRVVVTGQEPDVTPYYALADVLAISSLTEGSPNVLLEAMAAGVPVVATAVGGIPEIVEHQESAVLVPAGDPCALGEAIRRVLLERSLAERLVANARRRVLERHAPEARVEALCALYRELAGRAPLKAPAAQPQAAP
jgi:glycosyltransferase involved in cell wall biosynthesis